ncbi:hypothetical protein GOBAR_AA24178 [Gossypium barbadense]|uniref:Uncharacterized protein n=1 Tax=Gossypium barbadense TaxID=3634 RepID=A0A2P5WZI0_GOSBA|nr:hypothetical protein GOBAR_AA24178 [Gossypium barbadense]
MTATQNFQLLTYLKKLATLEMILNPLSTEEHWSGHQYEPRRLGNRAVLKSAENAVSRSGSLRATLNRVSISPDTSNYGGDLVLAGVVDIQIVDGPTGVKPDIPGSQAGCRWTLHLDLDGPTVAATCYNVQSSVPVAPAPARTPLCRPRARRSGRYIQYKYTRNKSLGSIGTKTGWRSARNPTPCAARLAGGWDARKQLRQPLFRGTLSVFLSPWPSVCDMSAFFVSTKGRALQGIGTMGARQRLCPVPGAVMVSRSDRQVKVSNSDILMFIVWRRIKNDVLQQPGKFPVGVSYTVYFKLPSLIIADPSEGAAGQGAILFVTEAFLEYA